MSFSDFLIAQFKGWRRREVVWLLFCVLSIAGLSLYWRDSPIAIVAAVTGMMYTILAGKGKSACFLFGLVNTPIYAYLSFRQGFYGDFALNVYYFAMMFAGLRAWMAHKSDSDEEGVFRTHLDAAWRLKLLMVCIAATLALFALLKILGGSRPLCDAMTNVLSIAAMYLTVRRAIEEWVLWIAVNAIEVFMWAKVWLSGEGMFSVLLMWLLFLVNGILIFAEWVRLNKTDTSQNIKNLV